MAHVQAEGTKVLLYSVVLIAFNRMEQSLLPSHVQPVKACCLLLTVWHFLSILIHYYWSLCIDKFPTQFHKLLTATPDQVMTQVRSFVYSLELSTTRAETIMDF